MGSIGVSESTVFDVFRNGIYLKEKDGSVKKYSGYEVGIFYAHDKISGKYITTYVWKRDRR